MAVSDEPVYRLVSSTAKSQRAALARARGQFETQAAANQEDGIRVREGCPELMAPRSRMPADVTAFQNSCHAVRSRALSWRLGQDRELLLATRFVVGAGLKILASQDRVDVLQACTAEAEGDGRPEQLIRLGMPEVVERRSLAVGAGRAAVPSKGLQGLSAFIPEDRHEGQDEVRLLELGARRC